MISVSEKTIGLVFQSLFIRLRTMAYENASHREIQDLCDGAEYLGGLIARQEDKTDAFGRYLRAMAERHNCHEALRLYESND